MNKFKNIFKDKILDLKRFIKDNRRKSVFLSLLVVSLSSYLIAQALNDPVTITSGSINTLHNNESPSSEVTEDNKLLNFSEADYKLEANYDLEGSTLSTPINLVIHIYVPSDFSAKPFIGQTLANFETEENNYKHYTYNSSGPVASNREFILYMKNIYKKTSNTNYQIKVRYELINGSESAGELTSDPIEIKTNSETNPYKQHITYGSTIRNSDGNAYIPVGIITYVPYTQMKGMPSLSSISEGLSISAKKTSSSEDANFALSQNATPYNSDENPSYAINIPYSTNQASVNITSGTNFNINVSINDIDPDSKVGLDPYGNNYIENGRDYIMLTTSYFVLRVPESEMADSDVSITINANNGEKVLRLSSNKIIGRFTSSVTFDEDDNNPKKVAYGSGFNFNINSSYAVNTSESADAINGFTTLVKLNENIKNLSVNDILINNKSLSQTDYKITYYKIPWSSSDFNTTSYTTDQVINLMGGPLQNSFNLESNVIEEVQKSSDDITYAMILIRKKVLPNSKIKIKLSAKVDNKKELVNQKLQVVTNSTITSVEDPTYYLGEQYNMNDTITFSNPNYYVTGVSSNKYGNYVSVVPGNISSISSNTYLEKTETDSETNVKNTFLTKQNSFYAGKDEPIVWNFLPTSNIGEDTSINKIIATVSFPKTNNYDYLSFDSAFLTEETSSIFASGGDTSSAYNSVYCKTEGSNCIYSSQVNQDGTKSYIFTITGENAVKSFMANGIFIKTSIDLIASSGFVDLNFSCQEEYDGSVMSDLASIKGTTNIVVVRSAIANMGLLKLEDGELTPNSVQSDLNKTYYYYMNSIIAKSSEAGKSNYELINILPHNTETDNYFHGTYKVSVPELPSGYTAYYLPKTENSVYDIETIKTSEFLPLTSNTTLTNENVVAIKIKMDNPSTVTSNNIPMYFGGNKNSIYLKFELLDNEYSDIYENKFYAYTDKLYDVNPSIYSTFNRTISGFAFEDFDYNGFYSIDENKLENLAVELYKVEDTDVESYSGKGTKVKETINTTDKGYEFSKLDAGNYYVKIAFDSDQYKVTDFEKQDNSMGNEYRGNSKFIQGEKEGEAISKLIKLDSNNNLDYFDINLGLKIQNSFSVSIDKYIKNIKIIKGNSIESIDYDHQKQVKLDFKDLVNTSFEVTYGFDIKNTKYHPGYIGTIVEAIPDQMTFDPSENIGWIQNSDLLYYTGYNETLIMPKETYSFEVKLKIPQNVAGDFINVITVGDLRILETTDSPNSSNLETKISTLGVSEGK